MNISSDSFSQSKASERMRMLRRFFEDPKSNALRIETASPEETIRLASETASFIRPGHVLALEGSLGCGKTVFVKGLAQGLGLERPDEVKSPTFVLMHIYHARMPIYHFDLYRLDEQKDLQAIGLEEFAHDPEAVTCVEWAEKGRSFLPAASHHIQFEISGESSRSIRFSHNK